LNTEQQIQGWSGLCDKSITEEEYNQIVANLDGFFSVLKSWDDERKNSKNERNDTDRNSNSST
jgi:hypothetical protein